MIAALRGYNDVHYLKTCIGSTSHTGGDNDVRMVAADELVGSDSSINLTDATLHHDDFVVADATGYEVVMCVALCILVGGEGLQLSELLVHRHNYSYLHYIYYCYLL